MNSKANSKTPNKYIPILAKKRLDENYTSAKSISNKKERKADIKIDIYNFINAKIESNREASPIGSTDNLFKKPKYKNYN